MPILSWLLIPAMAIVNRFRGGGFYADRLPGHPRYYVAVALAGALMWMTQSMALGALMAVSYLVWAIPPWGHLMCLGHWTPDRPISVLEAQLLRLAQGNILVALALRHVVFLVPIALVLHLWWPPLLGLAMAGGYWLGWRLSPMKAIMIGELVAGALWGVILLVGL
jgi:hypothetical protein